MEDAGSTPWVPSEAGQSDDAAGEGSETGSQTSADGGDAAVPPPWDVLDFTGWSLDLPVDAQGKESGTNDATVLSPINASTASAYSRYFYSGASGGVVFSAPVDGATTTNSNYPRCELGETAYSKAHGGADWPLSLGGTMNVEIAVDDVPSIGGGANNGDIVIGQIKGKATELCKVRYTGGSELIDGTSYSLYVEYNNATVSGKFGVVPVSAKLLPNRSGFRTEIHLADNARIPSRSYTAARPSRGPRGRSTPPGPATRTTSRPESTRRRTAPGKGETPRGPGLAR